MSNLGSFSIKRQVYVSCIPTTFRNNPFAKSCLQKNTFVFFSSLNTPITSLNLWLQQIPLIYSYFFDKVVKCYQGTLLKEIWLMEVLIQLSVVILQKQFIFYLHTHHYVETLVKQCFLNQVDLIFDKRSTALFLKLII